MPHSYIDLQRLKGTSGLNLGTGTVHDVVLRVLVENVSEAMDRFLQREIMPLVGTRHYSGPGGGTLIVDDLISVTSLKEDDNMDGTFNVTWGTNDYHLAPYNAEPTKEWGRPYTRLEVSEKSNGTQDEFRKGRQNYQIVGTWGYQYVKSTAGLNGTLASTSTTSLNLSGTVGTIIAVGQSLEYNTEIVYVTDVPNSTSTAVTVRRAQRGSTATSGTAQAIQILEYPGPVVEATFIQAARVWRRKDSAFSAVVGVGEGGQTVVFSGGLDNDVKLFLQPYRRLAI